MTANQLLLYRIAELMLEQEQHLLPVDLLFDDAQIGDFVKSIQIDSPYQQMLLEGVLTESVNDEMLFVSFTVEGYFHYVLGEVILERLPNNDAREWVYLAQSNRLRGLLEGITLALIREVQAGRYDVLFQLIDADDALANACVQPLVIAFTSGNVSALIDLLLENRTDTDLRLLGEVIDQLNLANRSIIVRNVLERIYFIVDTISFETGSYFELNLKVRALMVSSDDQIGIMANQLLQSGESAFQRMEPQERIDLLVGYYNLLVNKGLISKSVEFAEQFNLYSIDANRITKDYYNFIYPLLEVGKFEQAVDVFNRLAVEEGEDGFLLNWSGFIFQSWYELKSEDERHLAKGLELYERSADLIEKDYGRYSIRKYENLENLGYTYGLMGEVEKGLQCLNQAIEIVGKSYRTYITYKLGNLYEMKAQSLLSANRLAEAMEEMDKSDACKMLQVDENSSEMSWNYHTRAHILLALGRKSEAKITLKRALDIRITEMGKDNDVTIDTQLEYDSI